MLDDSFTARSALLAAGLAAALLVASPATGATINAPMGDAVEVPRLTYHTDGNLKDLVRYTVEIRNGTVKFEDAPVGLGEEGRDQVETFHFSVENPSAAITVITKTGQDTVMSTLEATEGSYVRDLNGFKITVAGRSGSRFALTVRSVDPDKALSHVTFGFDSSLSDAREFANVPVSSDTPSGYEDIVYGIENETGNLVRHDFSSGDTTTVGTITNDDGEPLTGIDAGAYLPGLQNTFTFWEDPDDGQTKMVYVDLHSAEPGEVGQSLGEGDVTGATLIVDESSGSPEPRVFVIREDVDSSSHPAQLVEVDPTTGDTAPVMDLTRQYDSVASSGQDVFYASDGEKMYQLNPATGEEINVGIFEEHDLGSLEVIDGNLSSFENTSDRLIPTQHTTRVTIGDQDTGMSDVGTIIESVPETDPYVQPQAYD
jgi:hypothetical protein